MRQLIKIFFVTVGLVFGLQSAWGYSLLGPRSDYPGLPGTFGDAWQTAVIGYDLAYEASFDYGGPVFLGDVGGPKNIGEGYRRNVQTLYYTYDANFLDFFGSNGPVAVDSAFAIMNSLTNVDSYSTLLSEFPLQSQSFNFEAQALGLTDLKSETLHLLVEQMGLDQPERFTWTLHDRFVPPGCPITTEYLVVQRNFDFVSSPLNQVQYSPYVNDTLYSFFIVENCTGPNPLAYTVPFSVDPLADQFSAVAANVTDGLQIGGFYTGLTRDDVAGLRYLLSSNNIVTETAGTGSVLLTTNIGTQEEVITTANLNTLLVSALTNNPTVLQTLFPGLIVTSSNSTFAVACTPTITTIITNLIGAPFGTQTPYFVTNSSCAYQQVFSDVFANVITNGNLNGNPNIINTAGIALNYSPNTTVSVVTTSLGSVIGAPYGSPLTANTNVQTVTLAGTASGEYFILPAGQCGLQIVSAPLANAPIITTNVIATATATNGFVASQTIITSFTPHQFLALPINCSSTPDVTGLYQGIENVKFARADFDSLLSQFFQPVTNNYTMVVVTNSQAVTQHFQRVVTAPDILFSAADLALGAAAIPFNGTVERSTPNYGVGNIGAGLAGPGVINSPSTFTYNKVGNIYGSGPTEDYAASQLFDAAFLDELTQVPLLTWASFDSSTNDPVVYPDGTSIANLENEVLVQVSPTSLADGTNGVPYGAVTFTATGGSFSPPFTWSATGLPANLTLSPGGILSGTPVQSGIFDFTVELTDSLSRTVQWTYSITIH